MEVPMAIFVQTGKIHSSSPRPLVPYIPRTNKKARLLTNKNTLTSKVDQSEKSKTEVNFPGLNYIVDTSNGLWFQILWAIIILVTTLLCLYQVFDRFQYFFSNPISSKISIEKNESVKFPDITLCSLYGNARLLDDLRTAKAKLWNEKNKSLNANLCDVFYRDLISENLTYRDIWKKTVPPKTEFNIFRKSRLMTGPKVILHTNSILDDSGNCNLYYLEQLLPYMNNNQKLWFKIWPDPNMCAKYGLAKLFIHDRGEVMLFNLKYITLAYQRIIEMRARVKERHMLNRTDNICETNEVIVRCKRMCLSNALRKKLICKPPFDLDVQDKLECANATEVKAVEDTLQPMYHEFEYENNCTCPRACTEIVYHWSVRSKPTTENTTDIFFSYETNNIEIVEEYYAYSIISMLCDVGGNLGLYLGLCIPSIIELFQSCIRLASEKAIKRKLFTK